MVDVSRTARRVGLQLIILIGLALVSTSVGFVGTATATDTAPTCGDVGYETNASGWYEVENVSQLQCIEDNGLGEDYVLVDDINASGTGNWNSGAGFDTIGSAGSPFSGTLDGAGYEIHGLYIDAAGNGENAALFGGVSGAVTDVGMVDANISAGKGNDAHDSNADNGGHAAGLTIDNTGEIRDSYVLASRIAGGDGGFSDTIHANNDGGDGGDAGGLARTSSGTITHSTVIATDVTGGDGGDAGTSGGAGNGGDGGDAGGLVGTNSGTVQNLFGSTDPIAGSKGDGGNSNGSPGTAAGVIVTNDDTAQSTYWDYTWASTLSDGGGIAGGTDSGVTGNTTEEMQGSSAETKLSDLDFTSKWETIAGDYPILQTNPRSQSTPHKSAPSDAEQATILDDMDLHNGRYNVTSDKALQAINRNSTTRGWDYRLVVDVDANGTDQWNGDSNPNGFDPIGGSSNAFTGTFDGNGHAISNLTIDRGSSNYVGLFGYVDSDGTIENVGVENVDITGDNNVGGIVGFNSNGEVTKSYATGNVSGNLGVGGLVGDNGGGDVNKSYATGDVSGSGNLVGGFVGDNGGNVSESYATGDVDGDASSVGGLVGRNFDGDVSESYATGDVSGSDKYVGGLVGYNNDDVSRSYATGDVSGNSDVGGLVGLNNGGTVSDGYWDGDTTGQTSSAGSPDANGLTTDEMQGLAATDNLAGFDFVGNWHATSGYPALAWEDTDPYYGVSVDSTTSPVDAGGTLDVMATVTNWGADGGSQTVTLTDTDFSDSQQDSKSNVALDSGDSTDLTLSWATSSATPSGTGDVTVASDDDAGTESVTVDYYGGGDGSESDPYEIENWYHLDNVRQNLGAEFVLTADLDSNTAGYEDVASSTANSDNGFDPVGDSGTAFTGEFDGANYTISNLTIDRDSEENVGLFGIIDGGTVRATVLDSPEITGDNDVGGIAGNLDNGGTVTRSSVHGGSVVVKETDDGSDPEDQVGGIVGVIHDGTLNASTASVDVGDGTGREIGGLVGDQAPDGTVENVSFTGRVDGNEKVGGILGDSNEDSTLNDAFVAGSISGDSGSSAVGAVIGREQGGSVTVTDSYWDEDVTGQDDGIGAVQGADDTTNLSTGEMQNLNATVEMYGLDFDSTWRPGDGDYPDLAWDSEFSDTAEALDSLVAGDGDATPYEITTVYELQSMRYNLSANYRLANDINASSTDGWYDDAGFDPIGDNNEFTGEFDGDNRTISNLSINRTSDSVGLFGETGTSSTVRSVTLAEPNVTGQTGVGPLVGESYGTVTQVGVDGGNVTTTSSAGTEETHLGGLVGVIHADSVSESYSSVTIDANDTDEVGGIAGDNGATVEAVYFNGSLDNGGDETGGILGDTNSDTTVSEVYVSGFVDGTGAIVGNNGGNADVIQAAYWDGSKDVPTAGVDSGDGDVTNLSTSEMQGINATVEMHGLDFDDAWRPSEGGYPTLAWDATDPFFGVDIESTNEPVDAGDTLDVTANITNWGVDGSQVVTLTDTDFTNSQQDKLAVNLDSGESDDSVILQWDTGSDDDGTGDVTVATPNESDTETVTVDDPGDGNNNNNGGGGGGGGGASASSESGETSVTVGDDDDSDDDTDDESADDDDSGESRPDTSVSVSNPQPGQRLVIEGGDARIEDGSDDEGESGDEEGDDEGDDSEEDDDEGEDDDGDGDDDDGDGDDDDGDGDSGDGDGGGESTSNVRADRLSVDLNTDRDFELSITTYEGDLSRGASLGGSQSSLGPRFASGPMFPQAQPADSEVIAPEEVRAASAAFENETSTVSAGYVDIDHTLEAGEMSGASFEFSIRKSYLNELGVEADEVRLHHRQDGAWETRETEHVDSDGTHHRFEGTMPDFSVFSVGTGASPIGVTDAGLAASTIDRGEEATISATVANRGQGDAEETVELTVDGETVDDRTVSLEGGETTDIEFGYKPEETGEYSFAVGGADAGSLTVGDGVDSEDDGQSWGWLVVAILVTILVVVILWRRQTE